MDNPDSLKDLYATPDDRIDTLLDRSHVTFWRSLRNAMYENPQVSSDAEEIAEFVLEEFGVQLELALDNSAFKPEAFIKDEQKYLIFLLKYNN